MNKAILFGSVLLTAASIAQADTLCELPEPGANETTVLVERTGGGKNAQSGQFSAFDIAFEGVIDGNTLRYTVSNGDDVYNGLSNWRLLIDECIEALVDAESSAPQQGFELGPDGLNNNALTVKWNVDDFEHGTFDIVMTGTQGVDWAIGEVAVFAKGGRHSGSSYIAGPVCVNCESHVIPTPGAASAGLVLLGGMLLRRRRA